MLTFVPLPLASAERGHILVDGFEHDDHGDWKPTGDALGDGSMVEVCANEGIGVVADRIFPSPDSSAAEVFSAGGAAQLVSLDA